MNSGWKITEKKCAKNRVIGEKANFAAVFTGELPGNASSVVVYAMLI